MSPHVVADVGNTRIKWGRCSSAAVLEAIGLPAADTTAWERQAAAWHLPSPARWAVAGVQPLWCEQLADWLSKRGDLVAIISNPTELPLVVNVPKPEAVGIDRLLDAVAANAVRKKGTPALVIDAGSAVTVDWLDETGAFGGGAILPGFRLMAQALHDWTALLPLIELPKAPPPFPGTATPVAIEAGVYWAVAGGIRSIIAECQRQATAAPEVYLTGGDAPRLVPVLPEAAHLPLLTLEGIRLSALGRI